METFVKVTQVLPTQGGTSAATGKPWAVQTFIAETQEAFPKKIAFEIFGEQRIKDHAVAVDQLLTVSFDLESREFNGRWYTSARVWKVAQGDATKPATPQPMPMPLPTIPQAAPAAAPAAQSYGDLFQEATPASSGAAATTKGGNFAAAEDGAPF